MNQKYTPATAVAIKRDVQRSQEKLEFILYEIKVKETELVSVKSEVNAQRTILGDFSNKVASFFHKKNESIQKIIEKEKNHEQIVSNIEDTIDELSAVKDIIAAQIVYQKKQISEPKSAVFIDSIIKQLSGTLDGLLSNISASEAQMKTLEKQKQAFYVGNKNLKTEVVSQENKVAIANQKMIDINKQRSATLKELAREKTKLRQIKAREHDSLVMESRLTKEYKDMYDLAPKRKKK